MWQWWDSNQHLWQKCFLNYRVRPLGHAANTKYYNSSSYFSIDVYIVLPPFFGNLYSCSLANIRYHSSASPCHSAQELVCGQWTIWTYLVTNCKDSKKTEEVVKKFGNLSRKLHHLTNLGGWVENENIGGLIVFDFP